MHTTALYLKTNSFTNSIMHFIAAPSSTKKNGRNWCRLSREKRKRRVLVGCLAPAGLSAARAPLGSPSSSSSWKFLPSPEKREEDLNSSFCYPQDNRFIQTRSPESRKPGWPGCRPCEEAAARLLRVAARRSLCRFLVLLCSSSSSSSISPSASQAQLAKSTAGAIFRLCGRGSKKLGHGGPKIGLVVWRGQVGNGKFWFLGLKIRPKF